jgi:beta-lactamase regulating signal transducer with metallopeptidase domain
MTWIPDTILRALCWALLHSLWQGLIFAVVAGTIMVLTKRSSSTLRYNLLCIGLILFLAVSGYTFYLQLDSATSPALHSASQPVAAAAQTTPATTTPTTQVPAHTLHTTIDSLVQYFNTHAALVVLIWFIVFLARFVRLLSGLVYAQRIRHYQTRLAPGEWQQRLSDLLRKLRISRPVILLESALIKVPVVIGVLKPAILVPMGMLANLPAQQLESILLHELAHIRRRDYLFNLVQHVVDTLFFFNPALIWISSLIRTERENCCDDIAIRETRSRRQLIEALVSFHEYRQREGEFAVAFAGNKESQVVQRVRRIVQKTNHSLNAGERAILMGVLLVLCAAFITINNSRAIAAVPKKPAVVVATSAAIPAKPVSTTPKSHPKKEKPVVIQKPDTTINVPGKDTTRPQAPRSKPADQQPKSTDAINYLGFQNLSLDKLIEMKEHGVTADFILNLRKMGYTGISPDQAIRLRDHGVTIEYINSLIGMGYQPIDLGQAVELRDHGVTTDFIGRLNELGFTHISLEKARELVDHGVNADYIAACKKKFGKLFELNDYIKLRNAGINPEE